MTLSMEQLQALSDVAIATRRLAAAETAVDRAEEEAWLAGIADRQVAAVGRGSHMAVVRRRAKRRAAAAPRLEVVA